MTDILQAIGVSFKSILSYPDIHIAAGKTTFIQGPSGCGKSTLLRLFNATVSPDQGALFYEGKPFAELDVLDLRQQVLLVGQNVYLFPGNIAENFRQFYHFRERILPSEAGMIDYLSLCCADFPLSANCDTMSGGERQRVYIAICLSLLPKVLMLDEPTSALDNITAGQVVANLKTFCMAHDMTLLVVSHDLQLATQYADDLITFAKEA
jgi:putative ABC transport system ATP-binding protein